jgi:6-pyruvoyl-tetrahydropterin synthase
MSPKIEVSITRTFEAAHSLPGVGAPKRHTHSYSIECGYAQEIDPALGCARPMQDASKEVSDVVSRIEGRYLNDVLPGPPTAEMMACWVLAQLPLHWEWVSIRAYDGFMCRVRRDELAP